MGQWQRRGPEHLCLVTPGGVCVGLPRGSLTSSAVIYSPATTGHTARLAQCSAAAGRPIADAGCQHSVSWS